MYRRISERLSALPGITSVSAINHLPLAGDVWTLVTHEGRRCPRPGEMVGGLQSRRRWHFCNSWSSASRRASSRRAIAKDRSRL
jgi:hypothetical protein